MLYDPKWSKTTKADPLTLEALISWLQMKAVGEAYNFNDHSGGCNGCLAAQYYAFIGQKYCPVVCSDKPDAPFGARIEKIAVNRPWTFGAALDRARAMPSPNHAK